MRIVSHKRSRTLQGRCQAAAPVVHGEPPLGKLRHQQCLVQLSKGFLGWFAAAADGVWLDNLYIRSPVADDRISRSASPDKQHTILQWRPQQTAALWLSNVTTQGGSTSLFVSAASAYAEGATHAPHPFCGRSNASRPFLHQAAAAVS